MNRLKELREDNDLFQKDVAKSLGITQRNYSYFETGQTMLTEDILIRLANFYNKNCGFCYNTFVYNHITKLLNLFYY